ncbi:hypothetical protein A2U01_0050610, partial [Trifolium medium]|nr:hypothetical protein [Trifolium medium]
MALEKLEGDVIKTLAEVVGRLVKMQPSSLLN